MNKASLWGGLVSWTNRRAVLTCLEALHQQSYANFRIMVVDNGSTDGAALAVRERFPRVYCCALARNYGFARAANVILRHARQQASDYVLLLNADTSFAPDFLATLVAALETQPTVGIISPKIYLRQDPTRLWAVGGRLKPGKIRFYGLNAYDTGQFDDQELDFVMGCAMLIRTSVLRQTGLFDGRFFVFYEEIDLCVRARQAGWRVALVPEVHLGHEGGATTRERLPARHFYTARSRLLFLGKHRSLFVLPLLALYELALTAKIVAILFWQRAFHAGISYLRGAAVGLFRRGSVLREPYEMS